MLALFVLYTYDALNGKFRTLVLIFVQTGSYAGHNSFRFQE